MPPLVAAAPLIGTVVGVGTSLAGGIAAANGDAAAGANAQALGQYQAAQFEQEADTSVARAQRKMEEQQRTGKLIQSKLQANSAGSGLTPGVGSTSILSQQIEGRSTYSALTDLASGEDLAAGYENQAEGALYQGDLKKSLVPEEQFGAYAGAASSAFGTLGKAAAAGTFG